MRPEIQKKIESSSGKGINLEKMDVKDDEIKEIISVIKDKKSDLSFLSLKKNNLTDQGAIILAKELLEFKDLKSLDLQFNQIGAKGFEAVVSLKNTHPAILIAMHGNLITNTGEAKKLEEKAARPKI